MSTPADNTSGRAPVYCEAAFGRGSGFGNRLFPWARCRVFSERTGVPMLAPQWVQPRVGPALRGGIQLRAYHRQILLMGLFGTDGYVGGLRRAWVSATAPRVNEPRGTDLLDLPGGEKAVVVSFAGDGNFFQDLEGQREFVLGRLRAEARSKWVRLADDRAAPIGINVRCGNDFKQAQTYDDFLSKGTIKTPIAWFVSSLRALRDAAGRDVPAVVVSDGTREQLRELLDLPGVRFARPGCAISDLLILAQAKILIGSGGSSFSAWASYLSGAPTITHPGQSLQWFKVDKSGEQFVGEFDPSRPADPAWTRRVRAALGAGR